MQALLFGPLPGYQGLDVVLHGVVNKLVLGLGLDQAGTLRPNHLDGTLDIDFGVQAWAENERFINKMK